MNDNALMFTIMLSAIGFAGGFFGPMLFAPGANQGPMLGLFITGPLGTLLGGVIDLFRYFYRRRAAHGQSRN